MPFRSKAQRRKFYALKAQGKMSQKTIDEWEKHTEDKHLPERMVKKAFWKGFGKSASKSLSGPAELLEPAIAQGKVSDHDDTMQDRTMRDLEKGPRGFRLGVDELNIQDDVNPHLIK